MGDRRSQGLLGGDRIAGAESWRADLIVPRPIRINTYDGLDGQIRCEETVTVSLGPWR
jgi:hypothetical protein